MSRQEEILTALSKAAQETGKTIEPAVLDELSWDALSEGRMHPRHRTTVQAPLCVVRPESTGEVRAVVQLANRERIPVVPFGGGSGLMGGALSIVPCVALDLRRMNRVIEVDRVSRSARVQAGIILEALEQTLNAEGLLLGHDPWTVPVATIGGAQLWREALPRIGRIHLTRVHASVDGDTFFPELDPAEWVESDARTQPPDERHAYALTFVTLDRRRREA